MCTFLWFEAAKLCIRNDESMTRDLEIENTRLVAVSAAASSCNCCFYCC